MIQFAKKTGDYSVLSHADLCILALTYALSTQDKEEAEREASKEVSITDVPNNLSLNHFRQPEAIPTPGTPSIATADASTLADKIVSVSLENKVDPPAASSTKEFLTGPESEGVNSTPKPDLQESEQHNESSSTTPEREHQPEANSTAEELPKPSPEGPLYDDPSDEDDGEGEWITPSNVALHKSRHLDLLPTTSAKAKSETVLSGCMTADFAMQNVLLQMGLSLVGVEGKRIQRLKTWVLRCHACFKCVAWPNRGTTY